MGKSCFLAAPGNSKPRGPWLVALLLICVDDCELTQAAKHSPTMIDQLIMDSKNKEMLIDSKALSESQLTKTEVPKVLEFISISKNVDYRSYHLLFALRKSFPDVYDRIPKKHRSAILCSALKRVSFLNDWGDLDMDLLAYSDFEPAKAILEIGKPAIPSLLPLLDDLNEAILEGSEEATYSADCEYRRADWAHKFISLILGIPYRFSEDPKQRDKDISALKESMNEKNKNTD